MAQRSSSNNATTDKMKNIEQAAFCNFCHMKCSERKKEKVNLYPEYKRCDRLNVNLSAYKFIL